MKLASPPARTAQLVIAAMLALAVSLVWPSAGPVASSSRTHMHSIEPDVPLDHSAHQDHQLGGLPAIHVDCEPSGVGCCMKTLCHPGLTTEPIGMAFTGADNEDEAVLATDAPGSEPDVAVPPPRILPV